MLVARTVAEAHLYMDLQGADPGRPHKLVDQDGTLVAVYECRIGDKARTFEFQVIDPHSGLDDAIALGGDQPSQIIDPGEFVWYADTVSRRIPASVESVPPERRARAARAIALAAACVEEARKFAPHGAETIPQDAFTSDRGRQVYLDEPARFRVSRLEASSTALRRLAQRFMMAPPDDLEPRIAAAFDQIEALTTNARDVAMVILQNPMEAVQALVPRPGDYELAFDDAIAPVARAFYEPVWAEPPYLELPQDHTRIQVWACVAALFGNPVPAAQMFPGGYARVRPYLRPDRVWVAWKYSLPGSDEGLTLDGLVWLDDHWAWFPRPYRILARDRGVH